MPLQIDASRRQLFKKGKWTSIFCRLCCKLHSARRWLCYCNVPWIACKDHASPGYRCGPVPSILPFVEQDCATSNAIHSVAPPAATSRRSHTVRFVQKLGLLLRPYTSLPLSWPSSSSVEPRPPGPRSLSSPSAVAGPQALPHTRPLPISAGSRKRPGDKKPPQHGGKKPRGLTITRSLKRAASDPIGAFDRMQAARRDPPLLPPVSGPDD